MLRTSFLFNTTKQLCQVSSLHRPLIPISRSSCIVQLLPTYLVKITNRFISDHAILHGYRCVLRQFATFFLLLTSTPSTCRTISYPGWIVSTCSNSPHSETLGLGLSDNFHWGGVFWSKLWSSQIWSFPKWGGVFRSKLWSSKSEVFQNGGVFQSKLWSSQIWSFPKWGGGVSGLQFQKGAFWKIWTKIYCSARNLLVHHSSLSHTTYVETNKLLVIFHRAHGFQFFSQSETNFHLRDFSSG